MTGAAGRRPARGRRSVAHRATLALVALAALLQGGLAAAQAGYYPATPGTTWTYEDGETQRLSAWTSPPDGLAEDAVALRRTHALAGVPISEELLVVDAAGVRSYGTAAGGVVTRYDPPLPLFPAPPLTAGATWRGTARAGDLTWTVEGEVVGPRGVRTPAGRFNAVHVRRTVTTSSGARSRVDLFVVPGVGVVRRLTPDGTQVDLLEVGP
ncbi:MAG: hypothetical protein RI554_05565 [Trueperaceae bacterium]|nr:hypothetical protein [Trueperaceae bacterium]